MPRGYTASPILVATATATVSHSGRHKLRSHPTHLPTSLITHLHTPVHPPLHYPQRWQEPSLFHEGLRDRLVRPPGTPCLYYTPSQSRALTNVTRRQQNKPQRDLRRECFDSLEVLKRSWLSARWPYIVAHQFSEASRSTVQWSDKSALPRH
ncbi:hypothetical protein BDW75DRAFT_160562 [Aspergillus navahoensis]